MTVFKHPRGKTWRYDFVFNGQRYTGNTQQLTKDDAQLAEREVQLRLRHQAAGIADFFPAQTPTFTAWARTYLAYKATRITRPDHMQSVVPVLLRFWGAPGKGETRTALTPFHDLRLGDPIADADWLLKFEAWMHARGLGAQSRNHYRGFMRRMYALALQPEHRKIAGVSRNPFIGIPSDQTFERTVALSADQIDAFIAAATYHVRLAMAIGILAPKLRLRNILELRWAEHFDPDPRSTKFNQKIPHYIRVAKHKTFTITRRPLVTPVSAQLLAILKDAHQRGARDHVVTYRGKPLKGGIEDGVEAAATAAGIPYGRDRVDGATFHTLRHSAVTLLSGALENPLALRDAVGHLDLATTLKYRHPLPASERPAMERLSDLLQIQETVTGRTAVGKVQDRPVKKRRIVKKIAQKRKRRAGSKK